MGHEDDPEGCKLLSTFSGYWEEFASRSNHRATCSSVVEEDNNALSYPAQSCVTHGSFVLLLIISVMQYSAYIIINV
jgi:hypothetical protein